ncbi:MAG: pinensin family lanthipeptide [Bacteroidota bacterium]
MKNSKLKIDQLKVRSFVTGISDAKTDTVKGGDLHIIHIIRNAPMVLRC